jgi:rare lipoprotein A
MFLILLALYSGLSIPEAPTVMCSWYGEPFHGRETASGQTYDMNAMTFASCIIPLGQICEIRNPENGRMFLGRCTDTGPYKYDDEGYAEWPLEEHPIRKIDLSRAMADSLSDDGLDRGIIPLQYRIVGYSDEGLFNYND